MDAELHQNMKEKACFYVREGMKQFKFPDSLIEATVEVFKDGLWMQIVSEAKKSLFERLGGETAMSAVVENMNEKIFTDPELTDFFRKTDLDKQNKIQKEFLTMATGGPSEYAGKSMK
jgi:hypothetical protein